MSSMLLKKTSDKRGVEIFPGEVSSCRVRAEVVSGVNKGGGGVASSMGSLISGVPTGISSPCVSGTFSVSVLGGGGGGGGGGGWGLWPFCPSWL